MGTEWGRRAPEQGRAAGGTGQESRVAGLGCPAFRTRGERTSAAPRAPPPPAPPLFPPLFLALTSCLAISKAPAVRVRFHPPPPDAQAGARVQRTTARGESPGAPELPAPAASALPVLRPGLPGQVPPRSSRECCPGPAAKQLLALKAGCSHGSLSWLPPFALSPAATLLRAQACAEMPGGGLMFRPFPAL